MQNSYRTRDATAEPRILVCTFLSDFLFITGLKRQTPFSGSTQVAFSARLTNGSTPPMSLKQDIVFNDVLLNVSSAYHSEHGIFVAPVPGVYFFTTSLLAIIMLNLSKMVRNWQEVTSMTMIVMMVQVRQS